MNKYWGTIRNFITGNVPNDKSKEITARRKMKNK